MADYENILLDVDGAVATITLNRPEKLNATSPGLQSDLTDCLRELRPRRRSARDPAQGGPARILRRLRHHARSADLAPQPTHRRHRGGARRVAHPRSIAKICAKSLMAGSGCGATASRSSPRSTATASPVAETSSAPVTSSSPPRTRVSGIPPAARLASRPPPASGRSGSACSRARSCSSPAT